MYNNSSLPLEIGSENNGYVAYRAKILVDNGETIYRDDGYNYTLTADGFLLREKDFEFELIAYIGNEETITLPDTIDGNSYGLYYLQGLKNVIIPESFTSIDDYAFRNSLSLRSISIPDSVISIGDWAFDDCEFLTSIVIPDSVISIGDWAFTCSGSLTSVVIGKGVTSIGGGAFDSCLTLTDIYYNGTEADWAKINIGSSNAELLNATRYYYSETQPTTEGNFWHWVDGEPVPW